MASAHSLYFLYLQQHGWLIRLLLLSVLSLLTGFQNVSFTPGKPNVEACESTVLASDVPVLNNDIKRPGQIWVTVWRDLNGNGDPDDNEPGLANVWMEIAEIDDLDGQAYFIRNEITDDQGEVKIKNLDDGYYRVTVLPDQVPLEGLVPGSGTPSPQFINLGQGQTTIAFIGYVNKPAVVALTPAHSRTSLPGLLVRFAHSVTSSRDGEARLTAQWQSGTDGRSVAWPISLQRSDCNSTALSAWNISGPLTVSESECALEGGNLLSEDEEITLTLTANQPTCFQAMFFIPAETPYGAEGFLELAAEFTEPGDPSGESDVGPVVTSRVVDYLMVEDNWQPGLSLYKQVENLSRSDGGTIISTAYPDELQKYTITYRNIGTENLRELDVFTDTPPMTRLSEPVRCPDTRPEGLADCEVVVFGSQTNGAGYSGTIIWRFSGSLLPGASGNVSYTVRIE
ncbi:SdrD B-like domain-containing protein [Endozoicomonas sp.]|uniref:SdrD B-like domain-containing protein n=1 Tax=Endozoicomonas sp. TaxID=1892382 RepID=UPI0028855A77|nr:SdrD B-like domain-containing protein [Endozoicomonas sp.]